MLYQCVSFFYCYQVVMMMTSGLHCSFHGVAISEVPSSIPARLRTNFSILSLFRVPVFMFPISKDFSYFAIRAMLALSFVIVHFFI